MIKYNVAGLYEHHKLITWFLDLYQCHRNYFRPNVKIESVFGNFPYCTWDGGRNFPYYAQAYREEVINIRDNYLLFGVNPRFVFTNPELIEEDLDDRWCNFLLTLFHDVNAEVVTNSELVENYIKTKYPNYKIVSSTTKCLTNKDTLLEELDNDKYYQVCIDYNFNKNIDFLESIPKKLRHKVEFLCNAVCPPGCPHRKEHYHETGRSHLSYLRDKYTVVPFCGITYSNNHPTKIGKGNNSNEI